MSQSILLSSMTLVRFISSFSPIKLIYRPFYYCSRLLSFCSYNHPLHIVWQFQLWHRGEDRFRVTQADFVWQIRFNLQSRLKFHLQLLFELKASFLHQSNSKHLLPVSLLQVLMKSIQSSSLKDPKHMETNQHKTQATRSPPSLVILCTSLG